MNGFDPGPGWREVERPDAAMHGEVVSYRAPRGDEPRVRTWVREEPVSGLPTEPGYYIDADGAAWRLDDDGEWDDTYANPIVESYEPKLPLTRYEPRAVTAKALMLRLETLRDGDGENWREQILREFGAAS